MDTNNIFRKTPGSIIDTIVSIVENKKSGGETDVIINEEVLDEQEQLDELSKETLRSYKNKAEKSANDMINQKGSRGRPSAAEKEAKERRLQKAETRLGYVAKADAKHKSKWEDEYRKVQQLNHETMNHVRDHIGPTLTEHGYTKMIDHPKREVWVKADHDSGRIIHATVPREDRDHYHPLVKFADSTNTSYGSSGHILKTAYNLPSDIDAHKASAVKEMKDHVAHWDHYLRTTRHMSEEAEVESQDTLNENAAAEARAKRAEQMKIGNKKPEPVKYDDNEEDAEESRVKSLSAQMKKARTLGNDITFDDGNAVSVPRHHISAFELALSKKKGVAADEFQKEASKSHKHFLKAIGVGV